MQAKIVNSLGTITIANEVIANVAGDAATHCYGVVGMVARNAADGIATALRKDLQTKGIKVTVGEEGVEVELHVMVEYGVNIQAISDSIVGRVKYQVENSTGFSVTGVKVNVEAVRVEK